MAVLMVLVALASPQSQGSSMAAYADSAVKNAQRQINDKGNSVTLIRRFDCIRNVDTGADQCSEENIYTKGVVSNYTLAYVDNTTVLSDDMQVLVQLSLQMDKTWQIGYLGKRYEVINVTTVSTQDTNIIQKAQVRALG